MLVKFLSDKAVMPTKANEYDAGLDLVATSINRTSNYVEYGTDLAIAIPDGFVGLLCPRSSISNTNLSMCNSVGIIDAGYRGEVKARFRLTAPEFMCKTYNIGDKIAQLVIVPIVSAKILKVDELPESQRGVGGWGSSGT